MPLPIKAQATELRLCKIDHDEMGFVQRPPREAPPRTAKVSGSGSGIAAGRFILGIMETVLW
jgi:hypothetical protein